MSIFTKIRLWLREWFCPTVPAIRGAIDGLNYLSEGDCIWQMFIPQQRRIGAVTPSLMERLTGRVFIEERDFYAWFEHTIRSQTISQGQEIGWRYEDLRDLMTERLTDLQVYRMSGVSPFNLGVFVVGIDPLTNNIIGIFVGATET